jgi:hypothetical protein
MSDTTLDPVAVMREYTALETRYLVAEPDNEDLLIRLKMALVTCMQYWVADMLPDDDIDQMMDNVVIIAHEIGRRSQM